MVKDESVLLAAYDDGDGITGRIRPEHPASPQSRPLAHRFNPANFSIGLSGTAAALAHRNALEECTTSVYGSRPLIINYLRFAAFETVRYRKQLQVHSRGDRRALGDAGFALEHGWTDSHDWYAVTLARIAG